MNPNRIRRLLKLLQSSTQSVCVKNPYASKARSKNLSAYLQCRCDWPYSGHLLIGEAPGYKGCAVTGIPFTSQRVLASSSHPFLAALRPSLAVSGKVSEATATIVWDYLKTCKSLPAMWNAFPFHPHQRLESRSNRAPTKAELAIGAAYIQAVIDILCPTEIIAVGNTAEASLATFFRTMKFSTVRHPSFGGKTEFRKGVRAAGIR
jgi:uracil-DNA glycosylase